MNQIHQISKKETYSKNSTKSFSTDENHLKNSLLQNTENKLNKSDKSTPQKEKFETLNSTKNEIGRKVLNVQTGKYYVANKDINSESNTNLKNSENLNSLEEPKIPINQSSQTNQNNSTNPINSKQSNKIFSLHQSNTLDLKNPNIIQLQNNEKFVNLKKIKVVKSFKNQNFMEEIIQSERNTKFNFIKNQNLNELEKKNLKINFNFDYLNRGSFNLFNRNSGSNMNNINHTFRTNSTSNFRKDFGKDFFSSQVVTSNTNENENLKDSKDLKDFKNFKDFQSTKEKDPIFKEKIDFSKKLSNLYTAKRNFNINNSHINFNSNYFNSNKQIGSTQLQTQISDSGNLNNNNSELMFRGNNITQSNNCIGIPNMPQPIMINSNQPQISININNYNVNHINLNTNPNKNKHQISSNYNNLSNEEFVSVNSISDNNNTNNTQNKQCKYKNSLRNSHEKSSRKNNMPLSELLEIEKNDLNHVRMYFYNRHNNNHRGTSSNKENKPVKIKMAQDDDNEKFHKNEIFARDDREDTGAKLISKADSLNLIRKIKLNSTKNKIIEHENLKLDNFNFTNKSVQMDNKSIETIIDGNNDSFINELADLLNNVVIDEKIEKYEKENQNNKKRKLASSNKIDAKLKSGKSEDKFLNHINVDNSNENYKNSTNSKKNLISLEKDNNLNDIFHINNENIFGQNSEEIVNNYNLYSIGATKLKLNEIEAEVKFFFNIL